MPTPRTPKTPPAARRTGRAAGGASGYPAGAKASLRGNAIYCNPRSDGADDTVAELAVLPKSDPAALPLDRWLTAKQVAGHFALNEESVYRWRKEGKIPARYFKLCGRRRFLFHPDVLAYLEMQFRAR